MTQRKTKSAERLAVPGLTYVNQIMSAYTSAWDRHIEALNEVWSDCTCDDAKTSDWPKGWSKLLQTWSDNAHDICNAYTQHGGTGAGDGSPVVTFVIDQSAHADSGSQSVALPPGVDPKRLVATPLVSIQDRATQPPGNETLGDATFPAVIPLVVGNRVEIRIAVLQKPPPPRGHYLSVIYERKAGNPKNLFAEPSNPPPRPVIATVIVSFIDSPI